MSALMAEVGSAAAESGAADHVGCYTGGNTMSITPKALDRSGCVQWLNGHLETPVWVDIAWSVVAAAVGPNSMGQT